MSRDKWQFEYTADELAAAALTKLNYHKERLAFWQQKHSEITQAIRAEGVTVEDSIAARLENPKARDWGHGTHVSVRSDLQRALNECLDKLEWHTRERDEYDGWHQMLSTHSGQALQADVSDWQFFFGRAL